MRVLFICGHGKIENAIPNIKQRLKGAVELDTLGSLREIDSYFSKGHTFDKCVVLSPDRLIPDYTPDLLEGEMNRFKKIVSSKSIRADIVMCVTTEEDGLSLVDLFSDMLGELTIIKVSPQLKMTDLLDLIIQQGSTLAKKFPSYDLTTIAKNNAKEILDSYNKEDYVDLSTLVQQNKEKEVVEEVITPIGSESGIQDSSNSDDFAFNPNGFVDDPFDTGSDDFFNTNTDTHTSDPSMFDNIFSNKDTDFFKPESEVEDDFFNPNNNIGEIKDDNNDDLFNPDFGIKDDNTNKDDFFNPDFGVKDNTNNDDLFDTGFGFDTEDIKTDDDKVEEPVKSKSVKTESAKSKPVKNTKNDSLDFIGSGKKTNNMFNNKSENKKSESKDKDKGEKKSFFGFGGKKNATPKNNNIQTEDEYQLNTTMNNNVSNQNMDYSNDDMESDFSEPMAPVKEVSGKKGIGLNPIKNGKEKQVNTPKKAVQKQEQNNGLFGNKSSKKQSVQQTPIQEEQVEDNSYLFDDDNKQANNTNSGVEMSPGGLVDATSLFQLDEGSNREIERGQGRGLETTDVGPAKGKVGKQTNKNLEELLKPYLKRGALFVVTGSPNTGKTVISANIANLLCRYGYRVCVLDLDFQGKGQSYLNLDTFRTVHGGFQLKMNSVNVVNSTGTDFAKWTDVVKSGYHVITTTLNSDVDETHNLVRNETMGRLVRQLTSAYNFVIVDVGFHDLVTYFKDFADTADMILSVEEATQKGLTTFMLNMTNIADEDITNVMFSRLSLVLNKEDGMKSLFGKKVNRTNDILETLDDTVSALAQQMLDYSFTDIPVVSILKYSNVYEKFWYTNKYITDTKDGDRIFTEMLQNALNNL